MMKLFYILLFLPVLSFAANSRDVYGSCLDASNKLESPADRDAEKIDCFNKRRLKPVALCLNLARVLEHTTAADSLILDCISDNVLTMKIEACVETAKNLYYAENKDKAIWNCIENQPIRRSRCKSVTDEMVYPHNKTVALNYCLSKN